jgi:hypothetical protein
MPHGIGSGLPACLFELLLTSSIPIAVQARLVDMRENKPSPEWIRHECRRWAHELWLSSSSLYLVPSMRLAQVWQAIRKSRHRLDYCRLIDLTVRWRRVCRGRNGGCGAVSTGLVSTSMMACRLLGLLRDGQALIVS